MIPEKHFHITFCCFIIGNDITFTLSSYPGCRSSSCACVLSVSGLEGSLSLSLVFLISHTLKGRFNWQMGGERDMTVAKSVTEKCDRKFLPVLEKKAKWHLIRYTIVLYKQVKGSKSHKGTVMGAHSREGQGKQRVWNRDCMEGRRRAVQPSFRPTRTTVALGCYYTPRKDVRELLLKKLKNLNLDSVAATEGNRCC